MDNETLFYVCGVVLAVSALLVTFVGLKSKDFPGKALPVVILWFAVFVLGATTFAVRYSGEEQEARAAELEEAGEAIEEAEAGGGFENEGAQGGETEEGEEEAEEAAEGPEEEPVGPTTGSKEGKESSGKGGVTEGEKGARRDSEAGAGASTTLDLAADESALAFDKTELSAKPGRVTIDFNNPSPIPHNVVILKDGKELAGFDPISEGEEEISADLEAGSYTFICSVPGHAQAGMEGTLSVE